MNDRDHDQLHQMDQDHETTSELSTKNSLSGSLTGRDFSITVSTSVKIAVLAPRPRPRDRIAAIANPGFLRRTLQP